MAVWTGKHCAQLGSGLRDWTCGTTRAALGQALTCSRYRQLRFCRRIGARCLCARRGFGAVEESFPEGHVEKYPHVSQSPQPRDRSARLLSPKFVMIQLGESSPEFLHVI